MPWKAGIDIIGLSSTLRSIGKSRRADGRKVEEGLRKVAKRIYDDSQKLVPEDSGDLKRSGEIFWNRKQGFGAQYHVTYGGVTAPYALIVEVMDHLNHAPPTRSRYLRTAIENNRKYAARVTGRIFKAATNSDDL